ncbi:MAG: hypothetical protein D6801_07645 [Alphaproteobacteria bacterium]|nr:MAG: hypothetical protein D6801_07645 [Alphaproteobacteria bacterium]
MALLARITFFYLLAGSLVVTVFRDDPLRLLGEIAQRLPASLTLFVTIGSWALPVLGLMLAFVPRGDRLRRLSQAVVAVFLSMAFFLVFTMLKTTMPHIQPFWADGMLAATDRALHFGHDPWALAHRLEPWIDAALAGRIYFDLWAMPAMFLPVLLILTDGDAERVNRFIRLHAFAWIVLGNIVALALLSAGPVYHDRLLGGDGFAGLAHALAQSGVADSRMGAIQERLWQAYVTGAQEAGSGISAFPSVHLAMATVIALYLYDRWRFLAPMSVALVATYLFLSVYLGWHYAIDGYFSIAAVTGVWAWLRRREALRSAVSSTDPAGALVAAE